MNIHYRRFRDDLFVAYAEPTYRWCPIVMQAGQSAAEAIGLVMLKDGHSVVDDDAADAKQAAGRLATEARIEAEAERIRAQGAGATESAEVPI